MQTTRRYDIDWLRVIAIGLLLVYHVAIGFQPWGTMLGFITNKESWPSLWIPMSMLNVWRIPLLFFVSGMGVFFSMQKRNWIQLMAERATRILVPYVFGMFVIVPIYIYLWQAYHKIDGNYTFNPGHLWFLWNIVVYVAVLSPLFFYLKKNEKGRAAMAIRKIFSTPLGFLLVIGAFIAEVMIVKPVPYELYATTTHGFVLGFMAFFFGFCFVFSGRRFLELLVQWRWVFLVVAAVLVVARLAYLKASVPGYLLVTEAECWIFSVLAFGHMYLNRGGKALTYLSQAAYPVYILHMVFLYLGSLLIFPLDIPVVSKFAAVLFFTFGGCFGLYEVIRRVNLLRPVFGLKIKKKANETVVPGAATKAII